MSGAPPGHAAGGGRGRAAAGYLVAATLAASLGHEYVPALPAWVAGACSWLAALLLAPAVTRIPRLQALAMAGVGAVAIGWAMRGHAAALPWQELLTANTGVLAMLAAVGFLRLVSRSGVHGEEPLPRGPRALAHTLLGTALLGAVINISAIIIVGDRIGRNGTLSRLQGLTMSRGFMATAMWSPFFASMAVAVHYAPGVSLTQLVAMGLPIAIVSMVATVCELGRDPQAGEYVGFPLHLEALALPCGLACLVLAGHRLAPALPILVVISTTALALTALLGAWRRGRAFPGMLLGHVRRELPRMSGEFVLFVAAGVLAVGISTLARASGFELPFSGFGAREASLVLIATVIAGIAGLHPIVSVTTWAGLMGPLSPDPALLGLTWLMCWSLGVTVSPMSGLHLFIQGRFGVPAWQLARWNARYGMLMLAVYIAALHLYDRLL